ncbi:hypothetical protein MACH17_03890 [Phaeobacter inhibens]|uniref:hypothetical protein n=1 Tax=Phaeobacter inhibens TaxID=221822 RepID=UPI0027432903|nr:hypothetical protein [Phaeobacter inhibens]GLO68872.1 hypothetical protein MACH17_03890 [Phaeobacter inhibens]
MQHSNFPSIQGKRFNIETLQYNAVSLMKQADNGPTFLRHGGRVSYVVLAEELFDQLWPDPRRAWSIYEMPLRMEQLFFEAVDKSLAESEKDDSSKFDVDPRAVRSSQRPGIRNPWMCGAGATKGERRRTGVM